MARTGGFGVRVLNFSFVSIAMEGFNSVMLNRGGCPINLSRKITEILMPEIILRTI